MSKVEEEGNNVATAEAELIPETELDESAFNLIQGFRKAFRSARDFQEAAAQVYIGQLDYGFRIDPDNKRKIEFWRGNVYWGIEYNFTNDHQTLIIDRTTHISEEETTDDMLRLQSRRHRGDSSVVPGKISHFLLPTKVDLSFGIGKTNSFATRDKAQEILTDFDPSILADVALSETPVLHLSSQPQSTTTKHLT